MLEIKSIVQTGDGTERQLKQVKLHIIYGCM